MKVRMLTVSTMTANGKNVPAIRLSGEWLGKVGFGLGKKIIVREQPGQLTIHLITFEEGHPCE